jgi:hypothetical protein
MKIAILSRGPRLYSTHPKGSREILSGDVLLCFGKALTLKSLAPRARAAREAEATQDSPPPA